MFNNRTYRRHHKKKGLVSFDITVKETNLNIQAQTDLTDTAIKAVLRCRNYIETYIKLYPEFATSLLPLKESKTTPKIISKIIQEAPWHLWQVLWQNIQEMLYCRFPGK